MAQTINKITDDTVYIVSIQVSLNGLSFCIKNTENAIIHVVYKNFDMQLSPELVLDKIKFCFDTLTELQYDFKTIEVVYQNDLYTLVPSALFDANMLKEYLSTNIKVFDNDFIAYDELPLCDIVVVYIPYANINNYFFENFGSFTYKHTTSILVNTLSHVEKHNMKQSIYVHINNASFDCIAFDHSKFLLCNTFTSQTKEDFLYYLMFVVEQLGFNPEVFDLIFLGDITSTHPYYTLAYQYIRNISIGYPQNISKEDSSNTDHSNRYFTLLNS
ncbi:DUF3822 family protein [Aquimarina sp. W85]|uniref:DUF3822 family protein n=1 Tax=Aquimarina rhodophyticola TaxID=3342246 RepID=UPI0036733B29